MLDILFFFLMKTEEKSSAEWGRENGGGFNTGSFGYSHSGVKEGKQTRNEHLLFTLSPPSPCKPSWFFFCLIYVNFSVLSHITVWFASGPLLLSWTISIIFPKNLSLPPPNLTDQLILFKKKSHNIISIFVRHSKLN